MENRGVVGHYGGQVGQGSANYFHYHVGTAGFGSHPGLLLGGVDVQDVPHQ